MTYNSQHTCKLQFYVNSCTLSILLPPSKVASSLCPSLLNISPVCANNTLPLAVQLNPVALHDIYFEYIWEMPLFEILVCILYDLYLSPPPSSLRSVKPTPLNSIAPRRTQQNEAGKESRTAHRFDWTTRAESVQSQVTTKALHTAYDAQLPQDLVQRVSYLKTLPPPFCFSLLRFLSPLLPRKLFRKKKRETQR